MVMQVKSKDHSLRIKQDPGMSQPLTLLIDVKAIIFCYGKGVSSKAVT